MRGSRRGTAGSFPFNWKKNNPRRTDHYHYRGAGLSPFAQKTAPCRGIPSSRCRGIRRLLFFFSSPYSSFSLGRASWLALALALACTDHKHDEHVTAGLSSALSRWLERPAELFPPSALLAPPMYIHTISGRRLSRRGHDPFLPRARVGWPAQLSTTPSCPIATVALSRTILTPLAVWRRGCSARLAKINTARLQYRRPICSVHPHRICRLAPVKKAVLSVCCYLECSFATSTR